MLDALELSGDDSGWAHLAKPECQDGTVNLEVETMNTAKSEVASMLETFSDNSSLEDIQYHLYVLEKVKRGVKRGESEGTLSHTEAKQRLSKWFDN